jgi:hypothetical protein
MQAAARPCVRDGGSDEMSDTVPRHGRSPSVRGADREAILRIHDEHARCDQPKSEDPDERR